MKSLVGDDWKVLVGVEQPIANKGCSPGYHHETYWPTVIDRLATLTVDASECTTTTSDTNITASSSSIKLDGIIAGEQTFDDNAIQ
jgi:hypothetical protein